MKWTDNKVTHWILVLCVFACTGTAVARLDTWLVESLDHDKYGWLWWMGLVVLLPVYYLLLAGFGFVFGKYNYFRERQKRALAKVFGRKKSEEEKRDV